MNELLQALKWLLFIMLPKLPRKLSDDPAKHSDFDIGWSLQDGWRRHVAQHVRDHGPDMPPGQARSLERVRISVVFVKRMGSNEAIVFARPNASLGRLPDVALALLLGVPEDLARQVDQAIRREDDDLLSSEHVLVVCEYVDGFWRPLDVQRNHWGVDSSTRAGIEDAVRKRLTIILRRLRFANSDAEEEIAGSLSSKWDEIVESHYNLLGRHIGTTAAERLRSTRIEVIEAHVIGADRAMAVVQTNVEVEELTDLTLALLLGTREDLARDVYRSRSELLSTTTGYSRRDRILVFCLYGDGEWDFAGESEESRAAEPETRDAIGEAVQLQTSWKEPPFAITVLGPPEPAGDALVKLPVRIASVLPRWRLSDVGFPGALLETAEAEDGSRLSWDNIEVEPRHTFPADLALIKGGSHEGHLLFGSEGQSLPDRPFTELHFLDETEQIVMVELGRRVRTPERVRFDEGSLGTLWDDPPVDGVSERLRGSQWANTPVSARVRVGETVEVVAPTEQDVEPSYALAVLGLPEAFDERTLRVRLRITSREEELRAKHLDFQLSPAPDMFGRLEFLWESLPWHEERADLLDSFQGVTLRIGETHEAFVYFRIPDEAPALPTESLAVLWYGPRMFELPILLSPIGTAI